MSNALQSPKKKWPLSTWPLELHRLKQTDPPKNQPKRTPSTTVFGCFLCVEVRQTVRPQCRSEISQAVGLLRSCKSALGLNAKVLLGIKRTTDLTWVTSTEIGQIGARSRRAKQMPWLLEVRIGQVPYQRPTC